MLVRSVIFDFADTHGVDPGWAFMAVSNGRLLLDGVVVSSVPPDTAYESTYFDVNTAVNCFTSAVWVSEFGAVINQRIIYVFSELTDINGFRHSGEGWDIQPKNVKVYTTGVEYTNTTYGANVENFTLVFDAVWPLVGVDATYALTVISEPVDIVTYVSKISAKPAVSYLKDPDALLDYTINWSQFFGGGDKVTSVEYEVENGITVVQPMCSYTDTKTVVWLTGGVAGQDYKVTCRAHSWGVRTADKTIRIMCRER